MRTRTLGKTLAAACATLALLLAGCTLYIDSGHGHDDDDDCPIGHAPDASWEPWVDAGTVPDARPWGIDSDLLPWDADFPTADARPPVPWPDAQPLPDADPLPVPDARPAPDPYGDADPPGPDATPWPDPTPVPDASGC